MVQRWISYSSPSSPLIAWVASGFQSPMTKRCETIRVPTLSCFHRVGRMSRLNSLPMYKKTTVAWSKSLMSSASPRRASILSSSLAALMFAFDSVIRSASRSMPTPFFAPAFTAAMTIRESPQPGSKTMSSLVILASSIILAVMSSGVGT